jgi:DNA-binding transcriptional LysR family regulator
MLKQDLNLLAIFDALYEVRSVTQTARRLNLTQSAVSHALRRLRQAVDDPLFVRTGGALQPTVRARAMAGPIRDGLARLREATLPTPFDPQLSPRTFTVAASSYFCALLIPDLIAAARAQAPGVRIRTVPLYADLLARLDEGAVDLALGAFSRLPAHLVLEPLFREELVWIAAGDNPVVEARPGHAELLAMPHLALDSIRTFAPPRPYSEGSAWESALPAEQTVPPELHGSELTPAIVYDTLTAIAVVAGTDLVASVPRRLALSEQARHGIAIIETGEAGPGVDLVMISRARSFPDGGHDWLRSQVLKLAARSGP